MELSEFNSLQIGDGVELSPATDLWMRGDRYGVITKEAHVRLPWGPVVRVRTNKSGAEVWLTADLLQRTTVRVYREAVANSVPVKLSKFIDDAERLHIMLRLCKELHGQQDDLEQAVSLATEDVESMVWAEMSADELIIDQVVGYAATQRAMIAKWITEMEKSR